MTLLARYKTVFQQAWAERDQLAPEQRLKSELEFLPAALELVETPPSPTAHWLLYGTIVFITIALLWACFGKLDIIVVAQGKVIPSGQVKVVQSYERAVVKRLLVHDGMQVKQGQVLIELDASELSADQEKVRSSYTDNLLAAARARSLLTAAQSGAVTPALITPSLRTCSSTKSKAGQAEPAAGNGVAASAAPCAPIAPDKLAEANHLLLAEYQALRTQLQAHDAEAAHLQAERDTVQASLVKLQTLYPFNVQRTEELRRLMEKAYVSKYQYQDEENKREEAAKEIDVQHKRLAEIEATITHQQQERNSLVADFLQKTREQLSQAEQQLVQLHQDATKLAGRNELLQLRAPVDGTVQQLAVHTEGGVVTEAQPLLVVVPANDQLEIEAMVENKDIGFVSKDQQADVKVEAFPFTRYGILSGKVVNVSLDAVSDEKKGLLYQTRVLLDKTWIGVEGKRVALVPGMAVSVEIKTGRRRVIDYFLSPVLQYGNESVRER